MHRLMIALLAVSFLNLVSVTPATRGQGKAKADEDEKLALYLQKDVKKAGISKRKGAGPLFLCSVDPSKFSKTKVSVPASALAAIVEHSKDRGRTPNETEVSDGTGRRLEKYIIGAAIHEPEVATGLCKQIKARFKLGPPLKLNIAHDVKNKRVYVDVDVEPAK